MLGTMIPCIFLVACSPKIIYLPGETEVVYRDSIITKIDTLSVEIPKERIVEVVPILDTLTLDSSVSTARAWVDTSAKMLKGEMKTKGTINVPVPSTEQYHQRDSIVREPYPVEVEKVVKVYPKWLIIIAILGAVCITAELLLFFMKR